MMLNEESVETNRGRDVIKTNFVYFNFKTDIIENLSFLRFNILVIHIQKKI